MFSNPDSESVFSSKREMIPQDKVWPQKMFRDCLKTLMDLAVSTKSHKAKKFVHCVLSFIGAYRIGWNQMRRAAAYTKNLSDCATGA